MALAALVIGISKTSIGGFAALAVAVFAVVMPAKESTAAVLLLLIIGDVVGVAKFRRDCRWELLRKLLPSVLPGLALGALFMAFVDDNTLRRAIGVIIVLMVAVQLVMRRRQTAQPFPQEPTAPRTTTALATGTAAGFTTMTANAAGAVMTLYLLACRVDKRAFVGTNAWFFLLVNLSKTPFSFALGLFPRSTLLLTVALAPFVLAGTWLGARIVHRLSQARFEQLALLSSVVAAAFLLVR